MEHNGEKGPENNLSIPSNGDVSLLFKPLVISGPSGVGKVIIVFK